MKKIAFIFVLIFVFQFGLNAQNSCLYFAGNDWVNCGNDASLDAGMGSFTVEFWAKRNINVGGTHPISKGYYQNSPIGAFGWNFRCNSGDKRMYFQIGDGNYISAIEQVRSDDGLYHHFAG
ncbi:MAG: hypothetical protein K8R53_13845, partial [Bacteroidales bacterium]|nr:hypothetical protein [Bacteroidales bacterium]